MNESVWIRYAEKEDIPVLVKLLAELIRMESDFKLIPRRMEQGLQLLLSDRDTKMIFVAEINEKVVGMCGGQLFPSSAEGGMVLLVEDFIVTGAMRGRGIGKQLLQAVEQWGAEKGAKRFQLLADRDNTIALKFYKRQGWTESGLTYMFKRLNQ